MPLDRVKALVVDLHLRPLGFTEPVETDEVIELVTILPRLSTLTVVKLNCNSMNITKVADAIATTLTLETICLSREAETWHWTWTHWEADSIMTCSATSLLKAMHLPRLRQLILCGVSVEDDLQVGSRIAPSLSLHDVRLDIICKSKVLNAIFGTLSNGVSLKVAVRDERCPLLYIDGEFDLDEMGSNGLARVASLELRQQTDDGWIPKTYGASSGAQTILGACIAAKTVKAYYEAKSLALTLDKLPSSASKSILYSRHPYDLDREAAITDVIRYLTCQTNLIELGVHWTVSEDDALISACTSRNIHLFPVDEHEKDWEVHDQVL